MRLNVLSKTSDPPELIERFRSGVKFQVLCDSGRLAQCFAADTETGEAYCYEADVNGRVTLHAGENHARTIRRTGKITIKEILAAPTV